MTVLWNKQLSNALKQINSFNCNRSWLERAQTIRNGLNQSKHDLAARLSLAFNTAIREEFVFFSKLFRQETNQSAEQDKMPQ